MNYTNVNGFDIIYTNADSLLNKRSELNCLLKSFDRSPDVIVVAEIKPKNHAVINLAEFSIEGYNIFSNDLEKKENRGLLIFINNKLGTALVDTKNNFEEKLIIKIKKFNSSGDDLLLVSVYRSPNSSDDNNSDLNGLIDEMSASGCKYIVWVGDFNFPHIDWENLSCNHKGENEFLETILDNFLIQNVNFPTRARAEDCPHILDLIISNDDFVDGIECLAPLGASDHAVLKVSIKSRVILPDQMHKLNYQKGNYSDFKKYLNIDWSKKFEKN
jgi:hypothetical protein